MTTHNHREDGEFGEGATVQHLATVRAARIRTAEGATAATEWSPAVRLDVARQWARETADGDPVYLAQFTHLDGSVTKGGL